MDQTPQKQTAAAVRAELGRQLVTGRQLARDLGWKPSNTRRRITGETKFTVHELVAIADYLSVPLTDFLPASESAAA